MQKKSEEAEDCGLEKGVLGLHLECCGEPLGEMWDPKGAWGGGLDSCLVAGPGKGNFSAGKEGQLN